MSPGPAPGMPIAGVPVGRGRPQLVWLDAWPQRRPGARYGGFRWSRRASQHSLPHFDGPRDRMSQVPITASTGPGAYIAPYAVPVAGRVMAGRVSAPNRGPDIDGHP